MNERTKIETPEKTENMQLSILHASSERSDTMTHDQKSTVATSPVPSSVQLEGSAAGQNTPPPASSQLSTVPVVATPHSTQSSPTAATLVPSKTLANARAASQTAATISDTTASPGTADISAEPSPVAAIQAASSSPQTESTSAIGSTERSVSPPPPTPQTVSAAAPVYTQGALSQLPPAASTSAPERAPATVSSPASASEPAKLSQPTSQSTTVQSTQDKGKDFEAALSELEKIVGMLEGEVKLEEALKLFDRGMNLSQHCHECLEEAEQRIDILKRALNGTLSTEKFNEDSINAI